MNKYIKSDLEDSINLMKAAIMNTLFDIDSGEETHIDLGKYISCALLYDCLIQACWREKVKSSWQDRLNFISYWITPSGREVSIEGSFWCNQNYIISIC